MGLPQKLTLDLLETQWAALLNPLLADPLNSANLLTNVALINGMNVINHKLGRKMQGWFVTDINGSSVIYRSSPFNNKTITLTSSAVVTINLAVF